MASDGFLYKALSPLKYLNISELYSEFSTFIDFFIYLIIFTGLARFVFERRFPGKGGKLVMAGVGLILSLALTVTEDQLGFTLKSFGPIAGMIIVLLVGMMLYHIISKTGMSFFYSGSIVLIIIYFGMRSVTPSFIEWFDINFPLIHTLVGIAMLAFIIKGVVSVIGKLKGEGIGHSPSVELADEEGKLRKETKFFKRFGKVVKEERGGTKAIIKNLKDVLKHIDEYGKDPKIESHIANKLKDAKDREFLVMQKLDYLSAINQKLEAWDIGIFHDLKKKYSQLPESQQKMLREEIQRESRKINRELKMGNMITNSMNHCRGLEDRLRRIVKSIRNNKIDEAKQELKEAIEMEERVENILKQLKKYEIKLLRLTKREVKDFKKTR